MRRIFRIACLTLALGGVTMGASLPARAAEVVVGNGGIAFGYADGYWDRGHQWHRWHDQHQAANWRRENAEHYYARRHDRDHEEGWRDQDRYWEHR
jgi:hypothetical protein